MRTQATPMMQQPDPGPAPQRDQEQLILGRYKAVETRGRGGFGSVVVCWDTRLQRRVAIKCLPLASAYGAATSSVDEALAEARTACLLAHPNIVTVFDFEADDSYAYLVMEYVDGITLAELLARVEGGVLTFEECAHLLASLAGALSFAHENGVLHLDIKPANVFIDRSGAIKLGDFGMASLASAAGWGGARGGTVGYMPPEQLSGDLVDERTDVFSLGVVCYQALTGTAPFVATTPEASEKLIERGAAPLDTTEPELAGACSDAIDSALDPNPAGRMSSVTELADDMVDQLGDPAEGRTSLADLMGQLTDDEQESESWREFERAPLAERAPWLPGILLRALTACACATAAARIAPGLSLDTTTAVWALCAGCALAGAILPPLGSALVLVGLVVAIGLAGVYTSAFLVASLVAVAGVAWWAVFGRTRGLAAASLLLPCCVMVPEAGVALAAWGLSPAAALATGAFGWLLEGVLSVCIGSSFAAGAIFEGCAALITMSTTWVCALGCGLSACAGAALCQRGTKAATLGGQALTAGCLVAVRLVCARVENGGIWVAPNWASLGIALLFSLLMVLVTVVLGPPQPIREDD